MVNGMECCSPWACHSGRFKKWGFFFWFKTEWMWNPFLAKKTHRWCFFFMSGIFGTAHWERDGKIEDNNRGPIWRKKSTFRLITPYMAKNGTVSHVIYTLSQFLYFPSPLRLHFHSSAWFLKKKNKKWSSRSLTSHTATPSRRCILTFCGYNMSRGDPTKFTIPLSYFLSVILLLMADK